MSRRIRIESCWGLALVVLLMTGCDPTGVASSPMNTNTDRSAEDVSDLDAGGS